MTRSAMLPVLITVASMATVGARANAPTITPLSEYAERNGIEDKTSQRFILNRCTALHIFAEAVAKDQQNKSLADHHEIEGARYLQAAKAVSDQHEVMLMQVQRMSLAYQTRSAAYVKDGDPLADSFVVADISFCKEALPRLSPRTTASTN